MGARAVFAELEGFVAEAWAEVEHWQQLCQDLSQVPLLNTASLLPLLFPACHSATAASFTVVVAAAALLFYCCLWLLYIVVAAVVAAVAACCILVSLSAASACLCTTPPQPASVLHPLSLPLHSQDAIDAKGALKVAAVAAAEDTDKQILQQQLEASIRTNGNQREQITALTALLKEAQHQKTCFATEAYDSKAAMAGLQNENEVLEHCANQARELVHDTECASTRLVAKAQEQARQAEKANMVCSCDGRSMLCIANVHNQIMTNYSLKARCQSETYIYPPAIMNGALAMRARQ